MINLLAEAESRLGWPSEDEIFSPTPEAHRVTVELVDRKVGGTIRRVAGGDRAQIGLIYANTQSESTEAPLAIVCRFPKAVPESVIRETRRLCWSFSAAPQFIIVEPYQIRAFSCHGQYSPQVESIKYQTASFSSDELSTDALSNTVIKSLHWVHLISGDFFEQHPHLFKTDERADQLLLSNLKSIRSKLLNRTPSGVTLDQDICHDLLARIIFIQFLWDRKDSAGRSALSPLRMAKLQQEGILTQNYKDLRELLRHKADTYRFFDYLNKYRFNGDMFGSSLTYEQSRVKKEHLNLLADFIGGDIELESGQRSLWQQYAFDVIPLSFISSIYEEFLTEEDKKGGAHYTPSYIVDFALDGVLPWDGKDWDVKILDPACGSGIFLVKAYHRLIHRWKRANPEKRISVPVLRSLLEKNLFGVDNNPHAVRVASFSLYLSMCDEIEPMQVWEQVRFPTMRDKRLIHSDFFSEKKIGFRTNEDAQTFDIVLGNAPWGQDTAEGDSLNWAANEVYGQWGIANKNIGPLFLPKAAALVKESGVVSMLQPAQALLTNTTATAMKFRKRFFETYTIEEVVNFSALRFGLFQDAISPSALITFRSTKTTSGDRIVYISPKPFRSSDDDIRLLIEAKDVNEIFPDEAASEPTIWSSLFWGGRRDVALLNRVGQLRKVGDTVPETCHRLGIKRSKENIKIQQELNGRKILEEPDFPHETFLELKLSGLLENKNVEIEKASGTNLRPFNGPQAILKRSWKTNSKRFHGAYVKPDAEGKGALCSTGYMSIHFEGDEPKSQLVTMCFNSIFTVYFLFLQSGRASNYIPNANNRDILKLPLPENPDIDIDSIRNHEQLDEAVRTAFDFSPFEWALIQDFHQYTLPEFKEKKMLSSLGRRRTTRSQAHDSQLNVFIDFFRNVLQGTFGKSKQIGARVFLEKDDQARLPVRLVTFVLDNSNGNDVDWIPLDSNELMNTLNTCYKLLKTTSRSSPIAYQRMIRVYDNCTIDGREVTLVHIIKPDQRRHWTRSQAMRDADEVAADIIING